MRYYLYSALFLLTGCSVLRDLTADSPATGTSPVDDALAGGVERIATEVATGVSPEDALIGGATAAGGILATYLIRKYLKGKSAKGA